MLHHALDSLPCASVSGSYHLSVLWLSKDPSPNESATPKAFHEVLSRARHWHGAQVLVVPVKPYQNANQVNNLLNKVRAESLVAVDIELLPEFVDKNVFWRGNLSLLDINTFLPVPMPGFELIAQDGATVETILTGMARTLVEGPIKLSR